MQCESGSGTRLKARNCPLCGSTENRPEIASSPTGEACGWETLRQSWRGFFKEKVFLSYHRCTSCQLLYSPKYFTDAALGELYGNMPDNSAGIDPVLMERTQRGYFEFLRRHATLKGDYFELGPDVGIFTRYVAAVMAQGTFYLYEPNAAVWPQLRDSAKPHPTLVSPQMSGFSETPGGVVGVAVLIHVLDHLGDPVEVLKNLREKMVTGGAVLIVTHDERSAIARLLGGRWPAFCLQHPQLYNQESTAKLLAQAGFSVVTTAKSTNHFSLLYLMKHLAFALGLRRLASWLPSRGLALPLRLGNIITVAVAH